MSATIISQPRLEIVMRLVIASKTWKPPVGVIIDNSNYGRYLKGPINSALGQNYRPIEAITVDDGSADNYCESIASYGGRITDIFKENLGQASALNAVHDLPRLRRTAVRRALCLRVIGVNVTEFLKKIYLPALLPAVPMAIIHYILRVALEPLSLLSFLGVTIVGLLFYIVGYLAFAPALLSGKLTVVSPSARFALLRSRSICHKSRCCRPIVLSHGKGL